MAIALPTLPLNAEVKQRLVRFGGDLTPPLGGPVSRLSRMGSRYAIDVSLPALDDQAEDWLSARLDADTVGATLVLTWPTQPSDAVLGAPVMNGAGQLGATLSIGGLAPYAYVPAFRFFSFSDGTRNYLHSTRRSATADGSGVAAVPIAPMLRVSPPNGAVAEFGAPKLEGLIDGQTIDWDLKVLRWIGTSFTLAENA